MAANVTVRQPDILCLQVKEKKKLHIKQSSKQTNCNMIKYQFTKNTEDRRVCYIALFNNQQNPNHEKFCRTNDPAPFLNQ